MNFTHVGHSRRRLPLTLGRHPGAARGAQRVDEMEIINKDAAETETTEVEHQEEVEAVGEMSPKVPTPGGTLALPRATWRSSSTTRWRSLKHTASPEAKVENAGE